MNTNNLKKFASKSRELLINEVTSHLKKLEVKDINKLPTCLKDWVQVDDISFLEWKKKLQRSMLIDRVSEIWEEQVIEEISYLWFNRFVALRYMEVNNYLNYWSRVISSVDSNKSEPDIISDALHLIGLNLDKNTIYEFQDNNDKDGLYKYLIVNICNSLYSELPFMFEKISDYTELLFPTTLLEKWSFLDILVNEVDEDDFKEVEVLGWLYQYYISDKKDIVFEDLKKKKKKIWKESIPAATQLFTPKWIVKYMVQNSVGKTWLESHPNKDLQAKWEYYIESESTSEVNTNLKPEDITVLDPAMWSWHILVYAFEILFDIYKSAWYVENDIPKLIIENNLYWLEIDDRAWQIACFAIVMKARKYNKRIFRENLVINTCSIQETHDCDNIDELIYPNLSKLCIAFKQWKLLWSLITLEDFNEEKINEEFEEYKKENTFDKSILILPLIIKQAKLIYKKYSCVVSNPPYMGWKWMTKELSDFLNKNYKDSKSDLFSAFIERNFKFSKNDWLISMITMHSWMFLSSFEKLRTHIVENKNIVSMLHLWARAFKEIWWEVVQTTAFTLKNNFINNIDWTYVRLVDFKDADLKETEFLTWKHKFIQKQDNFSSIPWSPIAYWINKNISDIFSKNEKLGDKFEAKQGMATGDNDTFLRLWSEVNIIDSKFDTKNTKEAHLLNLKWFPYRKGGEYRKWFGNSEYLIAFNIDNYKLLEKQGNHLPSRQLYFQEVVSWTDLTTRGLTARYYPQGYIFDVSGHSTFYNSFNDLLGVLWLLNLKLLDNMAKIINPTLHFQVGDFRKMPYLEEFIHNSKVHIITQQNINISKEEWDSRETSWDFSQSELLKHKSNDSLETAYDNYCRYWEEKFFTQHKNEEELNRLFIEIYGLENEMTPEVELKDITLLKTETKIEDWKLIFQKEEIIKQFISYAVGWMMWRYSLDSEWLAFAGWEFDMSKYSSFKADDDGIIPVLSDEYFEDDIVARFKKFVKVAFGEEKLNKNLDFIASALGKKWNESSLDRIRKYFVSDFYKDHVQRYKKRPIYWMFSTWDKNKSFNCLVYLHRYDKWIIGKIRMDYLHKLQWNLEWSRNNIDSRLISAEWKEVDILEKEKNKILDILDSLKHYDEKLRHVADQKIELDLDDWVKVNYPKFGDLLEKIKL